MRFALQPVPAAVGANAVIVDRMKLGKVSQHMAGEPSEAWGLTYSTHRQLQVVTIPLSLERTPGGRQALAQEGRPPTFLDRFPPIGPKYRFKSPASEDWGRFGFHSGEGRLIRNAQFLVRNLVGPAIDGDGHHFELIGIDSVIAWLGHAS